jgi:uncharacterized protein (TIGR02271 family)
MTNKEAAPAMGGATIPEGGNVTSNEVVIPLYQETVNIGKREVDAGTVHLKKKVITETVNHPVELRHETLTVQREPGGSTSGSAAQGQAFQEQDFTIQLHREEPMVQTQVVQSGRIVAQKQQQTEQSNVQSQVRHEDIVVDKGDAQNVQVSGNVGGATSETAVGGATSPGEKSQGAGSSTTPTSGTITDLKTLTQATDTQSLAGRPVQLSNMKVQEVISPSLISIGEEGEQSRVYAYSQQPIENVKVGDKVNVTGTVKQPSAITSVSAALGADVAQRLNAQPFFVDAKSAQVSPE